MSRRPNALGALLRQRRRDRKIGFKRLAAVTGVEPETLRKWEVGETYEVPLRGVLLYARVVGISLDELERAALAEALGATALGAESERPDLDDLVQDAAAALGDVAGEREEGEQPKRSSRRGPPRA